ncbi:MAG TPA: tRNA (adenosine(37)-N6)-dimethylallyltransferase MiaA [Geminicoccaceae bacterium]|nr:tRNA (adenosine(37)-N6)-dimethylallyltransferase MiaA [Geminicoccaceae bacterium]
MTGLIVIAGPTASGKSALAMRCAEANGGVIINADSMQLYRELRILSARPSPEDEARAPHRLYGILDAEDPASAGRWLELAGAAIGQARSQRRPAIVVGGTGLYLHALLHGLAPVPEIPAAVRNAARARGAALGAPALHAELAERDPAMAARLRPTDRQRLIRAYEVIVGTGRSLAGWLEAPPVRVELPKPWTGIALMPPRAALYDRIGRRLRAMIEQGGLAEVEALRRRRLAPDLPLMRAVAVPELLAHLEGRIDLASAIERAIVQTRRYAKRQLTWLRHQLPELKRLEAFGDEVDLPGVLRCAGRG